MLFAIRKSLGFPAAFPRNFKMASGNVYVEEKLKTIFSKHLKENTPYGDNYVRGFVDGEDNLSTFLKEFEAVTHVSFSVVKSEKRTETSKRYSPQGKFTTMKVKYLLYLYNFHFPSIC